MLNFGGSGRGEEVTFTKKPLITWCKTRALRMSSNSAVSTTPSGLPSSPGHQLFLSASPVLGERAQWWTKSRGHLITVDSQPVGDSSAQAGKCLAGLYTAPKGSARVTNLVCEALGSILFPYSGLCIFQKSWARELWRFYSAIKEGILEELAGPEHSRASK